MQRREFLGAGTALPAIAIETQARSDALFDPTELGKQQLGEFVQALPTEQTERRQTVRDAADRIASWYTTPVDDLGVPRRYLQTIVNGGKTSFTWVRRVRKFYDVWEAGFGVSLPNLPVYRAYWFGLNISSVGNVLLAVRNLAEISLDITQTVTEEAASAVTDEQYRRFYIAAALVAVETVFSFYFPVDYKLAWKGTRYVNNRLLVRLRSTFGLRLYTYALSEIHFAIRGIRASQLNDPVKVSTYIDFLVEQSQTLADEFEEFEMPTRVDLVGTASEVISEMTDGEVTFSLASE